MIVIGLLLLIIGVAAFVDIALSSDGSTSVQLLGWHWGSVGPGVMLALGSAFGAVLLLGLVSLVSGRGRLSRTKRRHRQPSGGTSAENRRLTAALQEQHARLREQEAQLDSVRTVPASVPTGVVAAAPEPDSEPAGSEPAEPLARTVPAAAAARYVPGDDDDPYEDDDAQLARALQPARNRSR